MVKRRHVFLIILVHPIYIYEDSNTLVTVFLMAYVCFHVHNITYLCAYKHQNSINITIPYSLNYYLLRISVKAFFHSLHSTSSWASFGKHTLFTYISTKRDFYDATSKDHFVCQYTFLSLSLHQICSFPCSSKDVW